MKTHSISLLSLAAFCSGCAAQTPPVAQTAPGVQAPVTQTVALQVPPATGEGPDRITIRPEMLLNEAAHGDAFQLFDEPTATTPKTAWNDGYNKLYYPLSAWVDLGREYQINQVAVYDSNGTGDFRVESGVPFKWQPLFADPLTNYQQWNRHAVNVRTRFLHFILPEPGTVVPEVQIYGTPTASTTPTVAKALIVKPRALPTMDALIGTNAFIDDPVDKMAAVGWVREYHNWSWDSGDGAANAPAFPNNVVAFSPSAGGGGSWNFDDYYRKLKAAGITVCPAVQGSVSWLTKEENAKPVDPNGNAADPASYKAHADEMFQLAARYGSRKVADSKLKLAPNQARLSGLNLVRYYENANEPDASWHGREGYSTPFEIAARCSADYDGNQGKMGDSFGVKTADPNAQMVVGGLAGMNLNTIRAMKAWADWNRGGSFPGDALNVHHYSNDSGRGQEGLGKVGVAPEADDLEGRLHELVVYRNQELPTKELWFTEFGYDTHPTSVQRAPVIGTADAQETQARWLVRSYLAAAAAGVDRAAQYMLRDVNPTDATQFSNSGLVTQKGEWKPKTSWYYTATLKNRLTGMRFTREVPSGNPKVRVLKFASDAGKTAFVVWCPTSDDSRVAGFSLPLGTLRTATLVTLQSGQTSGVAKPLAVQKGAVSLEASEKPAIVLGF